MTIADDMFNIAYSFNLNDYWKIKFKMIEENYFESNDFLEELLNNYMAQFPSIGLSLCTINAKNLSLINYLNNVEEPNERLRLLVDFSVNYPRLERNLARTIREMISFLVQEVQVTYDEVSPYLKQLDLSHVNLHLGFDLDNLILLEDEEFRNMELYYQVISAPQRISGHPYIFTDPITIYNTTSRKIGLSEIFYKNLAYLINKLEQNNCQYKIYLPLIAISNKYTYSISDKTSFYGYKNVYYPRKKESTLAKGIENLLNLSENVQICINDREGFARPAKEYHKSMFRFVSDSFEDVKYFHYHDVKHGFMRENLVDFYNIYLDFETFFKEKVSDKSNERSLQQNE